MREVRVCVQTFQEGTDRRARRKRERSDNGRGTDRSAGFAARTRSASGLDDGKPGASANRSGTLDMAHVPEGVPGGGAGETCLAGDVRAGVGSGDRLRSDKGARCVRSDGRSSAASDCGGASVTLKSSMRLSGTLGESSGTGSVVRRRRFLGPPGEEGGGVGSDSASGALPRTPYVSTRAGLGENGSRFSSLFVARRGVRGDTDWRVRCEPGD